MSCTTHYLNKENKNNFFLIFNFQLMTIFNIYQILDSILKSTTSFDPFLNEFDFIWFYINMLIIKIIISYLYYYLFEHKRKNILEE